MTLNLQSCIFNECPWGPHLRISLRIDRYSRVACFLETERMLIGGGGGSHIDMVYVYVPAFRALFREIWYSDRGVFIRDEEPKLHKLGVFWANYCKKHPIWSKLGAFLSKMVYWWWEIWQKNWYRDSQIFEIRQAQPRTILVTPPMLMCWFQLRCYRQGDFWAFFWAQ